jgi:regulator of RNase E activity RraA
MKTNGHSNGHIDEIASNGKIPPLGVRGLYPFPISIAEMRERYLRLYTGAVNDVLRFNYQMHASSLPAHFAPLREEMKLAGLAFTVKGGPDITTEGEFEMRAEMLEALYEDSIVVWDCTGDTVTSQWGEVMTMAAQKIGCKGAVIMALETPKPF